MNLDSRIAHYRVTAKLGEGGMGEVYRATDTKLGREVAIKVLPARISRDATSLARFEREAKALASLNHPHIASIYGFDAERETHFLVLELVEGQTLSERLRRGRLPLDEALRVARQIAEAVEAAHAKGIIHRDLKPGNIKLTPEGRVKVLDFGLAKLEESVRGSGSPASDPDAPTLKAETTRPGMVMGTPAYMSPEQARGQEVDKRTDVWAFGCCLFECLAGSKPFRGDTVTDLMAEVLRSEPDWNALPADVPREVATLLHRCLVKDPRRRLSSLGDIALTLEDSTQSRQPGPITLTARETKQLPEPSKRPSLFFRLAPWIAVLVLGVVIVVLLIKHPVASAARASQIRSLAVLPFAFETQDPKLSGLGKWIPAEIRSKLGPLQDLQVVNSPARIEQLVQQKKSEVEIARELGVDGLVMGELHGQGETMSAYVWVVDGATGRALGKQREIASAASRVSEIPNLVALAIVDELKLQVSASQRAEIQTADTLNDEAFQAYVKGRDFISRRRYAEAAVEMRRAYQLDTNYTKAWLWLAGSEWAPLFDGGTTNQLATTLQRLSGEAERFHAQRPNDPAVASLRMFMAMVHERDWKKASAIYWECQRNAKPDPALLNVVSWYYTLVEGHPELALNARKQAIALEPDNILWQVDHGHQLFFFGRYDEALRAFRGIPPEKIQLEDYSYALMYAGDLAGAKEVADRVLAGRPNAPTQANLAVIHAKSGAPDEARRILRELEAQADKGMHIPYVWIATRYGLIGDFEAAHRLLRRGVLEGRGDYSMLWLRAAESLELFGKFPWYWEIVDEMKFPPIQMDNPYFALEQALRYGRGTVGPATTSTSTNEPPKTLAVLPFVNLGADKADEYLSDGMTEELLNVLAQVPGLRVPGRSSSFAFKGKNEDNIFRKVGEQLHVATVLEGSVRKAGDKLRITAQLISVADGYHLWSQTYDRDMKDILAVQTEVAQQVVQSLQVKLGVEAARALAKTPTGNPEAHRLYLLGRYHFGKNTEASFTNAMQYFNQALQQDPNYALAYCGLADCYGWVGGHQLSGKEAWAKEKELAQKALALDPKLADAHLSLGIALADAFDWSGGEREIKHALELNPKLALAYDQLAWLQTSSGRFDEAIGNMQKAIELDPLSLMFNYGLGLRLTSARRYDEAMAQLRKTLELDPNVANAHWGLGWCFVYKGDTAGAIAEFQKAKALDPQPWFDGALAYVYARAGDRAKAEQMLRDWDDRAKQRYVSPALRMLFHLGLDEKDQALDWLERCYEEQDWYCWSLKVYPMFDPLRTEPRFQALLKKVFPEP